MASVFKRGGKENRSGYWYASWFDHNGARRTKCTKTTDKAVAERIAAKHEGDTALRRDGVIDPSQDRYAAEARRSIADHLADFHSALTARENGDQHCHETKTQAGKIIEQSGAKFICDLTPLSVQGALKQLRDKGRSLKTCNHYLRAIKSFSRWLHRDKRTRDDALMILESFNAITDLRRVRREISPEELIRLITTAEGRTLAEHRMPGPDRAMAYRLALGTGFRAKELRSMTPASFDLDSDPPTVTVTAAHSKRRRKDSQPIRRNLAEQLRPWIKGRPKGEMLFARLPKNTARMLRSDLKAAREAWIAEAKTDAEIEARRKSDFLAYENGAGEVFDFHATRHTYISGIVNGGASVKVAQELARHSTPTLTIGRYAQTRLHDLEGALESLPSLDAPADQGCEDTSTLCATGTEGRLTPKNAQRLAQQSGRETVQKHAGQSESRRESDQ